MTKIQQTARELDFEHASMCDEAKFEPVLHRLTFREAIQRELLTDYRVAIIGVDNAQYRETQEEQGPSNTAARCVTLG